MPSHSDLRLPDDKKADLLLQAVQHSPVSVLITNVNGEIEYVNPKFTSLTGYTEKEILGENPRILNSGRHPESFHKQMWSVLLAGDEWRGEVCNKKKNGELYWEYSSISSMKDENGSITHFIAVKEDITDRRKIEQHIREERQKLDAIIHSIADGVLVLDQWKNVTLVNAETTRVTGFTEDEILGKTYKTVLACVDSIAKQDFEESIEGIYSRAAEVVSSTTPIIIECNNKHLPVDYSAAPVHSPEGDVTGCVIIIRDVTRQQQLERMKTDFISITSHQLRTPLTGIKWNVELLQEESVGPLAEQQRSLVEKIDESNQRIIKLVNDLLTISHLDSEKMYDLKLNTCDLSQIFKEITDDCDKQREEKQLTFDLNGIDSPALLQADYMKLKEAIANIINNAVTYSDENTVIKISLSRDKSDEYSVTISNTGHGISDEDQRHIFNKFFRGKEATKYTHQGSGLGLFITKSIIDAHKGKVWFRSVQNGTTTFYIRLPKS